MMRSLHSIEPSSEGCTGSLVSVPRNVHSPMLKRRSTPQRRDAWLQGGEKGAG